MTLIARKGYARPTAPFYGCAQDKPLRPATVQAVTDALAGELNQVLDQRPEHRRRTVDALADAERRLANLVEAVEGGAGARSLLEAIKAWEAEVDRVTRELDALCEPVGQKLAGWVRRQLEDVAGLLSESPERTKAEFRRLGVELVMHPVQEDGARPFYRAVGTTSGAHVLSGAGRSDFSASALTDPRQSASRTIRIVVDLPANHLGPGWQKRRSG